MLYANITELLKCLVKTVVHKKLRQIELQLRSSISEIVDLCEGDISIEEVNNIYYI